MHLESHPTRFANPDSEKRQRALAVAEAIRALGGGAYLVQQKDLTLAQTHTNFTISLIATAILIAAFLLLAQPLTEFFGRPELEPYLRVVGLGFLAAIRFQR
jgi:hypothetical protein